MIKLDQGPSQSNPLPEVPEDPEEPEDPEDPDEPDVPLVPAEPPPPPKLMMLPAESIARTVSVPETFWAYRATYPAGGISGEVTLEKLT